MTTPKKLCTQDAPGASTLTEEQFTSMEALVITKQARILFFIDCNRQLVIPIVEPMKQSIEFLLSIIKRNRESLRYAPDSPIDLAIKDTQLALAEFNRICKEDWND